MHIPPPPPQSPGLFEHIPPSPRLIAADVSRIDQWCWAPNGARQLMALSVNPCPLIEAVSCVIKLARGERETLNIAPASEDITATYSSFLNQQQYPV